MPKPPLTLQTTTLWEYPSQHYGEGQQGDQAYAGATPSWIIWNLLMRYTREKDLVVDPMAGSGTTLDVARDISRRALGYDLMPARKDVFRADARKLPLEDEKADFVFIDPPYSTHIKYSGLKECIGELSAGQPEYYLAMERVIGEINRILRPDKYMALYVSDSFEKGKPFHPIGMELFYRLRQVFEPVDVICVVRHNAKLKKGNWHAAAEEGNFFLRGFNYLFIMHKPATPKAVRPSPKGGQRRPGPRTGMESPKRTHWDEDYRQETPREQRREGGGKGAGRAYRDKYSGSSGERQRDFSGGDRPNRDKHSGSSGERQRDFSGGDRPWQRGESREESKGRLRQRPAIRGAGGQRDQDGRQDTRTPGGRGTPRKPSPSFSPERHPRSGPPKDRGAQKGPGPRGGGKPSSAPFKPRKPKGAGKPKKR